MAEEQNSQQAGSSAGTASSKKPISASLARLLAEAAAAYPGKTIWLTGRYEPKNGKHDIDKHDTDPGDPTDPEFGSFGPYFTKKETNKHDKDIVDLVLRWKPVGTSGPHTNEKVYSIDDCDMMVLSLAALDKFVIPYYARILGAGEAAQLRQRFLDGDAAVLRHLPDTEPGTGTLANVVKAFSPGI